jgi:hypothetical protein
MENQRKETNQKDIQDKKDQTIAQNGGGGS